MPVLSFIALTMIGSALIGGIFLGIVSAIAQVDISLIVTVPSWILFGSLFMIPFWFVVWALPSAVIFHSVKAINVFGMPPDTRVRLAGLATATVAALIFVSVNFSDRDIGWASLVIGLAAIVIATSVASRTHRSS